MRKIIYAETVSLDGFIEDSDGKIGWTEPSEELHRHFNEREKEIDTHLYGRRVYEIMKYWETADQNNSNPDYMREYSRVWKKQKKIVFSKTLESVENGYTLMKEVVTDEIIKWKNMPGKNMMAGGAGLACTFLNFGLVDEIRLYIKPILLGGGKPMFSIHKTLNLQFVGSEKFPCGVVMVKYVTNK